MTTAQALHDLFARAARRSTRRVPAVAAVPPFGDSAASDRRTCGGDGPGRRQGRRVPTSASGHRARHGHRCRQVVETATVAPPDRVGALDHGTRPGPQRGWRIHDAAGGMGHATMAARSRTDTAGGPWKSGSKAGAAHARMETTDRAGDVGAPFTSESIRAALALPFLVGHAAVGNARPGCLCARPGGTTCDGQVTVWRQPPAGGRGMIPVLTTERLTLRGPRLEDFEAYAAMRAEDRMASIGGPQTRAEAWDEITAIAGQWVLRGYGRWIVTETGKDALLSLVGIYHPDKWPEPEIGWTVAATGEGRGIAREAALAVRTHAYCTLGWRTIVSTIRPGNERSEALARRLGCRPDGTFRREGRPDLTIWRHPTPEDAA